MALKPEDFAVWYQFSFKHDVEYWGFLMAITHVKNLQVNRRNFIEQQFVRLRDEFLHHFKPKDDPKELRGSKQGNDEATAH